MSPVTQALSRLLFAAALLCPLATVMGAPEAQLWQRWTAHSPGSATTIDHSAWRAFLKEYRVMGDNGVALVEYGDVTASNRAHLGDYIDALAATHISDYSRDVQKAYWLNLYNALTVQVILDHYPVASIRDIDISPGFFADGPWGAELVQVKGVALTLDDIEHRILRPIWRDPRIHYGVNCASVGCPNLPPKPFTAANSDALLERAARAYINDRRGVAFHSDELTVSSIYEWFQADFGGSEAGVLRHLRRYAAGDLAARLRGRDSYDEHAYDWSLNAAPER